MLSKCVKCGNLREVNPNVKSGNYRMCKLCVIDRLKGVAS
jgi:hypothetical protein